MQSLNDEAEIRIIYEPTIYWSRCPGKFVNKRSGASLMTYSGPVPTFMGSVREWYETLIETIIDLRNMMGLQHARLLIHCSPEVKTILECSVAYRIDGDGGPPTINHQFQVVEDHVEDDCVLIERPGASIDTWGCVRVLDLNPI